MSDAAAHHDQRHKTGNHSNPERFHRITVQCVEFNPPRIGSGDLVNRKFHGNAQRTHPCCYPPMAHSSRQRDHSETNAFNYQAEPRLRLTPQQRRDEQQQRNHKSRNIDHAERARDDRSGNLACVWQTKRSHHTKRRRCDDRAEKQRCSQPGRQQSESRQIKNDANPF
jgi:hypothetical protein